jgi:hypothetical protein
MMVLLPFYRKVQYLVVFFLEKITAQIEGQAALHDAGGAVEAPLKERNADIASGKKKGVVKDMFFIVLKAANEPAKKDRVKGGRGGGEDKHQIDQNIFFPFLAGIAPGCMEERYIWVGH